MVLLRPAFVRLACLVIAFAMLPALTACRRVNPLEEMMAAVDDVRCGRMAQAYLRTGECLKVDSGYLEARILNNYCRFVLNASGDERDTAVYELGKCARLYPDNATAWYYYGYVLAVSGEKSRALEPLRKALELMDPDEGARGNVQLLLAECCVANNLQDEAQRLLLPLLKQSEKRDSPQLYNALGMLALKRSQPGEAAGFFLRGLQANPHHEVLTRNLAVTLDLYLNRPAAAIPYYRQCLAMRARSGDQAGVNEVVNRLRSLTRYQKRRGGAEKTGRSGSRR